MKSDVDKLDTDRTKSASVYIKRPSGFVKSEFAKTMYNTLILKITGIERKVPNTTKLINK